MVLYKKNELVASKWTSSPDGYSVLTDEHENALTIMYCESCDSDTLEYLQSLDAKKYIKIKKAVSNV